ERRDAIARLIIELTRGRRFSAKGAAMALPGNMALIRFIVLPKTKLDSAFGYTEEAKAVSPFDAQDTAMDASALGPADERGRQELMLLLAQKTAANQQAEILQQAGLRPEVIVNDAIAVERAFSVIRGRSKEETVILVNAGAATTSAHVIEDG